VSFAKEPCTNRPVFRKAPSKWERLRILAIPYVIAWQIFLYTYIYIYISVIIWFHDFIYIFLYAYTYLSARQVFLHSYFIFFFHCFMYRFLCVYTHLFSRQVFPCMHTYSIILPLSCYVHIPVCMYISFGAASLSIYKFYDSISTILCTDFCMYIHIALRGKSLHVCIHTYFIIITIFIVLCTYFIWSSSC